MKSTFKWFLIMCAVLGSFLGISRTAFAGPNCQDKIIVSYGKDSAKEFDPPVSGPYLVRGSRTLKLRVVCPKGRIEGLVAPSAFSPSGSSKVIVPAGIITESGNYRFRPAVHPFQEYTGTVSGGRGTPPLNITITDDGVPLETVVINFDDPPVTTGMLTDVMAQKDKKDSDQDAAIGGKANIGDSYTKPESDARYCLAGSDDPRCPKGGAGEGRIRMDFGMYGFFRPGGYDPGIEGLVSMSYRFGNPREFGFELMGNVGWVFAGATMPIRGVQGIPMTGGPAPEQILTTTLLGVMDIPVGDSRNFAFQVGGGLGWQHLSWSEQTVGNDPATQKQYFWPGSSDNSMVLQGLVGFRWRVTTAQSPAFTLRVGFTPMVQLIATRMMSGGQATTNQIDLPVGLGAGGQF